MGSELGQCWNIARGGLLKCNIQDYACKNYRGSKFSLGGVLVSMWGWFWTKSGSDFA